MFDVIEKENIILSHHCSQRCLRRIKGMKGDGPENFVCRKKHSVKDTPDCTVHQHIPLKVSLTPSCIEALDECGLCNIEDDDPDFLHPRFTPKSHMAPCDSNATNNISQVVMELEFFPGEINL